MRHSTAGDSAPAQSDFDRRLTADGRGLARLTGTILGDLQLRIDLVLCSSAVRTMQTADLVREQACPDSRLVPLDSLYQSSTETLVRHIRDFPLPEDQGVLVVAHNPGIAGLMCQWSGKRLAVPPATVTVFQSSSELWPAAANPRGDSLTLTDLIQDGQFVPL